jgi:uncharacterized membrane protein YkvA (DUF1232 family)
MDMRLRDRLKNLRKEIPLQSYALYLACRDPRTPWYAKALAAAVAAYAFSPIDLIPDFIPVLGYLDDLLIVPLGIALAIRLIPAEVLESCRKQARLRLAKGMPTSKAAAVVIVVIWVAVLAAVAILVLTRLKKE